MVKRERETGVWKSFEIHRGSAKRIHEYALKSLGILGNPWKSMEILGNPWKSFCELEGGEIGESLKIPENFLKFLKDSSKILGGFRHEMAVLGESRSAPETFRIQRPKLNESYGHGQKFRRKKKNPSRIFLPLQENTANPSLKENRSHSRIIIQLSRDPGQWMLRRVTVTQSNTRWKS